MSRAKARLIGLGGVWGFRNTQQARRCLDLAVKQGHVHARQRTQRVDMAVALIQNLYRGFQIRNQLRRDLES